MHKSGLIILGICGSRTEGARSSLCCISDRSIISSPWRSLRVCLALSLFLSLLYVRLPFSPRFVCSAFSAICHFPLLPSACTPTPKRFARPSPVTRFLYFRDAREIALVRARRPGTTKCQNPPRLTRVASAGNEKLPRGTRRRRSAEFRITIFCFVHLPSCPRPFVDPLSRVQIKFRSNFLDFSQSDSHRECFYVNIGYFPFTFNSLYLI